MPELPEVEAARRAIEDHCLGKKIVRSIIADDGKVIDGVLHSDFEASMIGKTIINALRKGKNMWLQLDSPPFPSFQFGMAGAIYIKGVAVTKYKRSAVKDTDEWPSKYSKFFIELDDGLELSFTDKRRFAKVRLLKDPASAPPISELGPDALLEPRTVDEFRNSISKKKIAIKALLLDQSYISGIGKWIADEVLYQAQIHPLQVAASLSKESCEALQNCIKEVIEKAIEVGADSSQFPDYWIFHSREKKAGKAFVVGKNIDFITAGGRTTAFVPDLQKLSGPQAGKEPSKPKNQTSRNNRGKNEDDEVETKPNNVKSKKSKNSKPQVKKPLAKRKSKESDSDDDEDNDGNVDEIETDNVKSKKRQNPKSQLKKPPVKRKSKESEDEDDDNVEDQKEKIVKVANKDKKSQASKKPK